jgi:hypothetical protein
MGNEICVESDIPEFWEKTSIVLQEKIKIKIMTETDESLFILFDIKNHSIYEFFCYNVNTIKLNNN